MSEPTALEVDYRHQIAQLTKERDQLAAQLKELSSHIRCIYCNEKYTADQSGELADHILSCEKSPLVQMVRTMESRITDYMDLMIDEFQRIVALTDNTEIVGICQRAMMVITQNEPVIKQRDDALEKLRLSESQVVQLLDENNSLKLDYSHSESDNAQLAAKCDCILIAFTEFAELVFRNDKDLQHMQSREGASSVQKNTEAGSKTVLREQVHSLQGCKAERSDEKSSTSEAQSGIVEEKERERPRKIQGIQSSPHKEKSTQAQTGLSKEEPLQGPLQNSTSQCGCNREDTQTDDLQRVWVGRNNSRAPQRLQQAIRRGVALQYLSQQEAQEILTKISNQCGEGWMSPEKKKVLRRALDGLIYAGEKVDTFRGWGALLGVAIAEAKQALEACKI